MFNEYNPFEVERTDFKLKLKYKSKKIVDVLVINNDQQIVVRSTQGKQDVVMIFDNNGDNMHSYQIASSSTALKRINPQKLIVFQPKKNTFSVLDLQNINIQSYPYHCPSWSDGQYQLQYFDGRDQLCLIQRSRVLSKLRMSHYRYGCLERELILLHCYQTQEEEWLIDEVVFGLDGFGYLGWGSISKETLKLKVYDRTKGVKHLTVDVGRFSDVLTEVNFKLLSYWKNSNDKLYIVVVPQTKDPTRKATDYSPLLCITTKNDFTQILNSSCCLQSKINQTYNYLMTDCLNLGDVSVLRTYEFSSTAKRSPIYIIDNETGNLIREQEWICGSQNNVRVNSYVPNVVYDFQYGKQFSQEIGVVVRKIRRVSSLGFQKMLEVMDRACEISGNKERAVIIFGAQKSGKSTIRHFLAGHSLIHEQNQDLGYFQLKPKHNEQLQYEHQSQLSRIVWLSETQTVAIFDIPDCSQQSQFFKLHINILLVKLFKLFKYLHFIIAIPAEYIEDTAQTIDIFHSVLSLVKSDQVKCEGAIHVVLTKIQDQSSLDVFRQKFQEIQESDRQLHQIVTTIDSDGKIHLFQNKQMSIEQGQIMLSQIVDSPSINLQNRDKLSLESAIEDQRDEVVGAVAYECQFIAKIFGLELSYLLQLVTGYPSGFRVRSLNKLISHTKSRFQQIKLEQNQQFAYALFVLMARLKIFISQQNEQNNEQKLALLSKALIEVANIYESFNIPHQSKLIKQYFTQFIQSISISLMLPHSDLNINPIQLYTQTLSEQCILTSEWKPIMLRLQQLNKQICSSSEYKQIKVYLQGGEVVRRQVAMSYEEQRNLYNKRKDNRLETIINLPCNILKLDLLIDEIRGYTARVTLDSKDIRVLNFYLRQCSQICHAHQLYYECLVFLVVIPDFIQIDLILDQLYQKYRKTVPYNNKKLFPKQIQDLINQLIVICSKCLRDTLVQKLINLKHLGSEFGCKNPIGNVERESEIENHLTKSEKIEKYVVDDEESGMGEFYNLKNNKFVKMLDDKSNIIEKGRLFQTHHKKHFEDVEAMHWMLDTLAVPTLAN